MTQIATVSATTAGYAAQTARLSPHQATGSMFEQRIHAWSEDAKIRGDAKTRALLTMIQPPALAIALITSPRPPQLTLVEAQRRYDENTPLPTLPASATPNPD